MAKTQTAACRGCGAEIPSGTKVCPECGKKQKKPIHKRFLFWFLLIIMFGSAALGGVMSTQMDDPEGQASSRPAAKSGSTLSKGMDLDKEQEAKVLDIFAQCGIGEVYSVETFHAGEEQTSYYVEDDETKAYQGTEFAIVVWLDNGTKEVRAIYFHDQDIYVDGETVALVSDFYVNREDRDKYRVTAQMLVNQVLLVPDSAKYPASSGWSFRLEDGVVMVQSTVTSKNAVGAELENKFQIKFQNGDPISLILDGKEYIQ